MNVLYFIKKWHLASHLWCGLFFISILIISILSPVYSEDFSDLKSIENQINTLQNQIRRYDEAYFTQGKSLISDDAYDRLYEELETLEQNYPQYARTDSPTQNIVSPVEKSARVRHQNPLYSLKKAYHLEALEGWEKTIKKRLERLEKSSSIDTDREKGYVVEIKLDGVAVNLLYQGGQLVRATTRGDGLAGQDITAQANKIESIPKSLVSFEAGSLPAIFEVRGEMVIPVEVFKEQKRREKATFHKTFSTPRHQVAGALLRLESSHSFSNALKDMQFIAYQQVVSSDVSTELSRVNTQWKSLNQLEALGFFVVPIRKHCSTLKETWAFIQEWKQRRQQYALPTDGVVVKVNSLVLQKRLGHTAKYPHSAIAYKYRSPALLTTVTGIEFTVGRTGAITPVILFNPVKLNGTRVSRASLHSMRRLKSMALQVGDSIRVEKAGGIIPHILEAQNLNAENNFSPSKSKTKPKTRPKTPIHLPLICPVCHQPLEQTPFMSRCTNFEGCPAQRQQRLIHWASRSAMGIQGMGPVLIQTLFEQGQLKTPADFYALTLDDLSALPGMGVVSATKMIQAIEQSKHRPVSSLIMALSIPGVGKTTAMKLSHRFKSIRQLSKASLTELQEVKGLNNATVKKIQTFFQSSSTHALIKALTYYGVI